MKKDNRSLGQSLVEFALIFPIVFFLIAGFLDLGRAVFYYSSVSNAVREATRYAIVHYDDLVIAYNNPIDNSLQGKVLEYSFGLDPSSLTFAPIIVEKTTDGLMSSVSITATYTFKPVTPGIKEILGMSAGIPLTAQSKMLVAPFSRK